VTSRSTSRSASLRGRRPGEQVFRGAITPAGEVGDATEIGPHEVVGCFGTDGDMVRAVPALVERGCTVKVFEDRPRSILPELRFAARPRRSRLLASTAHSVRCGLRAAELVPGTGGVRRLLDGLAIVVDAHAASAHRREQVSEPWRRRQLTPDRRVRRRPLRSDDYYRALQQRNCELVSWPIAGFQAGGVRTCDGLEHRLDRIVVTGERSSNDDRDQGEK
jgi:hypothetical protein